VKKQIANRNKKQGKRASGTKTISSLSLPEGFAQILLPLVAGAMTTKQTLHQWVYQYGIAAMQYLFAAEAETVAGPKHKKLKDREMHHWGSTETAFEFGGQKLMLPRPRVRTISGKEVQLSLVEHLSSTDPLTEHVMEQILLGVSTRGYAASLGEAPEGYRIKCKSKSEASRLLIKETQRRLASFVERRLEELKLCAILLDGIVVAKRSVIVALGVDLQGEKHPLGLIVGSTENSSACIELLQELLSRGLSTETRYLFVIDGGKGIHKAIGEVFGVDSVIQRCQNHKLRNVCDLLPKTRHAYVMRTMKEAYTSSTVATGRKRLKALVSWLESNGEDAAAGSLKEGLEETLTLLKLGVPKALRRTLSTTNLIENLMGAIRRVCRNVKRWKDATMIKRWTALAISTAQGKFRRIKGYRDIPVLLEKLNLSDNPPAALVVSAMAMPWIR